MRAFIRSFTIPTPFGDTDVLATIRGYDIEDIKPQFDSNDTAEAKADITEYILRNFDLCSENVWDIMLADVPEVEYDPNKNL